MTALCWGVYGPTLHRGQSAMAGSRLRPFLCVGLSYFLIAVIVPALLISQWNDPGRFTFTGSVWSLAGGTAGALVALGIIMAFTFGGKPIFVMPLVFGGAPVINTFVSVIQAGSFSQLQPDFLRGPDSRGRRRRHGARLFAEVARAAHPAALQSLPPSPRPRRPERP